MTRQILVDASLPIDLTSITYVIVQDDERGLIKTINIKPNPLSEQADAIVEIAKKYDITKMKIDLHGVGLGLFDYLAEKVGLENVNRKTGEVDLTSYIEKINTDESFTKIENCINDAIEEAVLMQKSTSQGSFVHVRALKTQVELERLKLKLIENTATLIEQVIIECGEYK